MTRPMAIRAMANNWSGPPPHGQLKGPGMPAMRNALPIGPVSMVAPILPMAASAAADTATEWVGVKVKAMIGHTVFVMV